MLRCLETKERKNQLIALWTFWYNSRHNIDQTDETSIHNKHFSKWCIHQLLWASQPPWSELTFEAEWSTCYNAFTSSRRWSPSSKWSTRINLRERHNTIELKSIISTILHVHSWPFFSLSSQRVGSCYLELSSGTTGVDTWCYLECYLVLPGVTWSVTWCYLVCHLVLPGRCLALPGFFYIFVVVPK